ncbi:MAG: cytochrome b/b6 domain-containing protein [Phaeovulum sp.]|uniref:cytochrome b/b6 domain-containing protein n=1 Tax=Phaeovulum sp. TaxID=2934796 RepID=UPI00273396C0|nr:cytochrome b/b6 domain-containing protein [Phaeovulum sp.]MDP3860370.1 cytochrome b/b6 domain-containing protein [Phaeovulum sp.]
MAERLVKVYSRFNRIWHWLQVLSILMLLLTGTRIMGLHPVLPFEAAVTLHTLTALFLLVLWAFATFWLFTTENWMQFIPRYEGLPAVIRFYAWGAFKGEPHPYLKAYHSRHNPLQALSYLALKVVLFPAIWISGLAYLGYTFWAPADHASFWLTIVANIHILAAFSVATFVVLHVYLLTIGHGFREHVRPMITGFEKVEVSAEAEAYFAAEKPERLKEEAQS